MIKERRWVCPIVIMYEQKGNRNEKLFSNRKEIVDGKLDSEEGLKKKRGTFMDCFKI